jgi:Predicted hydrolase of the alpha/beta-hydrolase fold
MAIELLIDGADAGSAATTLVLAHGAGAPMDSPFMASFAEALAAGGLRVVRFEFPYMAGRRRGGPKRPPDRAPVLLATWKEAIEATGTPAERLVIGGKSLGGRMASMIADEAGVRGLVCLGYPFHPPGKPEATRIAHLEQLRTPTLILQGSRDPFGGEAEVTGYPLSDAIRLHWLADGDHGFKPRAASGRTERHNWQDALAAVIDFVGRSSQ